MVRIRLGNAAPLRSERDPETDEVTRTLVKVSAPVVTEMEIHENDLRATLATVSALWATHSPKPPVWATADDDVVEALLANHFNCERGEPPAKAKKGAK